MASSTGGSIRHRADGRWEARYIDARGRRASRFTNRTGGPLHSTNVSLALHKGARGGWLTQTAVPRSASRLCDADARGG